MIKYRPFKALRPKSEIAHKVATLPYDVMNINEAKKMAENNPYSFLRVTRSEIEIDNLENPYVDRVYEKAKENLTKMLTTNVLIEEVAPMFYLYRQIMNGHTQTGIVGCASIDDYINEKIKKHEFTRHEKELDRIHHFDICDANTEPVFLTYRTKKDLNEIINNWINDHHPVYEFEAEDGITHILWVVDNNKVIEEIENHFKEMDALYIADGHHRTASAVKVGLKRRAQYPNYTGDEEFNYFLSVVFPEEDLYIMDYNRVAKDLNGHTVDSFIDAIKEKFDVREEAKPVQPKEKRTFGMYLDNKWYILKAKAATYDENDIIAKLDVSILQNNVLSPILGIEDPRTDKRIDFIGGIRGLKELEKRVHKDMAVAFSMFPTTIEDLIAVADKGEVMPPKSTWFEPKLRSGLFVHKLK